MKLDKHVVDMFTELTKPADDVKMEKTCYGTISVVDGTRYVKLDGSDLLVPAASTVKTSHGDRVTVLMKNHSLTVTGNLTAPATDGEGGSSGEAGTAATIEVGTVTTGEAGSSASVTNSGTTSAAVFDFVIPRGDKGEKGDAGPQGPQGEKGDAGEPGHKLFVGTDFHSTSTGESLSNLDFTETASIGDWYLNNQLGLLYQCVTAGTEGNSWWHYVATLSAKANGGNADTVDGLHAQKFMQYLGRLTSGSLLDEVLALDTSGFVYCTGNVTDTPETRQHFFVDIKNSGGTISLRATCFDNGATYTNSYNTSSKKWYGWTNVADGGNADTVGAKGITQILAVKGWFDGDMDNLREQGSYIVNNASNMPISGGWGTACVFVGGTGSVVQTFTAYVLSASDFCKTYIRHFTGDLWSTWVNIADGGNADTIDGKHANEFASVKVLTTQDEVDSMLDSGIYSVENLATPTTFGSIQSAFYMLIVNKYSVNAYEYNVELAIPYESGIQQGVYYRICADGTWGTWTNIADGGNANTVNGRSTNGNTSLIRYDCLDGTTDADTLISTGIYRGIFTNYPSELLDGQGTLVVINYFEANNETTGTMGDTTDKWIQQWFITPHANDVYCRSCVGKSVSDWVKVVKFSELIPKDLTNSISISTDSSFNLFTTSLKKIGNICTLSLNVTTNAVISNPMMTIGTLPESARPSTKIEHNTLSNNKGEVCWVSINTDGRLSVVKLSSTATWNSSDGVRTCITYMVDS